MAARAVDELFDMIDADGQGTIDLKELHTAIRPAALKHTSAVPVAAVCVRQPPFPRKGYRPVRAVLVPPPVPPPLDPFGTLAASAPTLECPSQGAPGPSAPASAPAPAIDEPDDELNSGAVNTRISLQNRQVALSIQNRQVALPKPALDGGGTSVAHGGARSHAASAAQLTMIPAPARPSTVDLMGFGRGGSGGLGMSQSMPSLMVPMAARAQSAPPVRYKEPPPTINPYSVPKTRPAIEAFLSRPASPALLLGRAPDLKALVSDPPDARVMRSPLSLRQLRRPDVQVEWFRQYTADSTSLASTRRVLKVL